VAAYRQDDYPTCAAWRRRLADHVDDDARQDLEVTARKLEAFGATTPYEIQRSAQDIRIPFAATDPLPVIDVTVGDRTVPFFLDTGADEVYLDQTLATDLGVPIYGTAAQAGAGGKERTAGHGRLDALAMGDLHIRNLPVKTLDFRALGFPEQWRGTIGTGVLSHFLPTIDYPGGALELRPRTEARLAAFEREARQSGQHVVPFWLSGAHYMLTWGTINGSEPVLLVADTGGAAIALYATNQTVAQAGITLQPDQAADGTGAAGAVRAIPFTVDELRLGSIAGHDLPGIATPDSDPENTLRTDGVVSREFRIGGFVSHQFFRPYALTIDFDRLRLFLQPG
jgi:predicted aspartyl protease